MFTYLHIPVDASPIHKEAFILAGVFKKSVSVVNKNYYNSLASKNQEQI